MGARLQYAKVVDRQVFYDHGGKVHPGLDNEVLLDHGKNTVAAFLVLRAWTDDHGSFTEQWRMESPRTGVVYESLPRELHLADRKHVERLEDEVSELELDYPEDRHEIVFLLEDAEVARVRVPIRSVTPPG
ncbi:MAG: hypothetical protein H0U16_10590 [Actinobacteria bacterium]|nr:hypothetical protein [Actinomycetota bacterium]